MSLLGSSRRIAFARVVLMLFLSVAFCGAQTANSGKPQNEKWDYRAMTKTPDRVKGLTNPLASDPDAVAAGGKLFEQHCSECHGLKAEGGKRGPSLLRPDVENATPGTLFWILTNGVLWHGMPDWSKLPEQERWQLVAFLKSFKAQATN